MKYLLLFHIDYAIKFVRVLNFAMKWVLKKLGLDWHWKPVEIDLRDQHNSLLPLLTCPSFLISPGFIFLLSKDNTTKIIFLLSQWYVHIVRIYHLKCKHLWTFMDIIFKICGCISTLSIYIPCNNIYPSFFFFFFFSLCVFVWPCTATTHNALL
jgi:hypothetical protein